MRFIVGAVSPIPTNNYEPFHWQRAMVSVAGSMWVKHFTAVPDDRATIQNHLARLRSTLGKTRT